MRVRRPWSVELPRSHGGDAGHLLRVANPLQLDGPALHGQGARLHEPPDVRVIQEVRKDDHVIGGSERLEARGHVDRRAEA